MGKKFFLFYFMFFSSFCCEVALANFTISSEGNLHFGLGVETITNEGKNTCLDFDDTDIIYAEHGQNKGIKNLDDLSETSAIFTTSVIDSYESFDKFQNINVSAKLKSLVYSGDFSFGSTEHHKMSDDEFIVGVSINKKLGHEFLNSKSIHLKDEYKDLQRTNLFAFENICGDAYISGGVREQGLDIMIKFTKKYMYDYSKLTATLNLSKDVGAITGSLHADFTNIVEKLISMGSLSVNVCSYGFTNNSECFSGILNTHNDLDKLIKDISRTISVSKHSFGVYRQYIATSYVNPYDVYGVPEVKEEKMVALKRFYQLYRKLDAKRSKIRKYLDNAMIYSSGDSNVENYVRELKRTLTSVNEEIVKINNVARECADQDIDTESLGGLTARAARIKLIRSVSAKCTFGVDEFEYENKFNIKPLGAVLYKSVPTKFY